MPRKASPQTPEVNPLIAEIKAYIDATGLSVNALALKAGTSQSSLQRFLAGNRKSVSKSANAVRKFMHNNVHNRTLILPPMPDIALHQAVMKVWDGKPESAVILAQLISALGPLVQKLSQPDKLGA